MQLEYGAAGSQNTNFVIATPRLTWFRKSTPVTVRVHEYVQPVVKTAINHAPSCTLSLTAAYRRHHGNTNQLVAAYCVWPPAWRARRWKPLECVWRCWHYLSVQLCVRGVCRAWSVRLPVRVTVFEDADEQGLVSLAVPPVSRDFGMKRLRNPDVQHTVKETNNVVLLPHSVWLSRASKHDWDLRFDSATSQFKLIRF